VALPALPVLSAGWPGHTSPRQRSSGVHPLHAPLEKWPPLGMFCEMEACGSANVPPLVQLAAAVTSVLREITAR